MYSKNSVLVTCPNYDITTRYVTAWAGAFIKEARKKGATVYAIRNEKVTAKNFQGMVEKNKPKVIFINGHGNSRSATGHNNKEIVSTKNASILKGAITYSLTCSSAAMLGKVAVSKGAKGYVGYSQDFIFATQKGNTSHPLKDETAQLFLDPSNKIALELLKGRNAKQATDKGKKAFTKSIVQALNSDIQSDHDKYVPFLIWNREALTFHE